MTTLELAQELLEDIKENGIRAISVDYGIEHDDMVIDGVAHAQDGIYLIVK